MNVDEYKGYTAQQIVDITGLPNPYADQSRYSLARQRELMLRDANRNGLLHMLAKTHPIKHKTINVASDKGVSILTQRDSERIVYTSELDLNKIPHKVEREKGSITIIVNKGDIPMNVVPNPGPGYVYHVIGIFTQEKCYHDGKLYEDPKNFKNPVGTKYRFGFHSKVRLYILDK